MNCCDHHASCCGSSRRQAKSLEDQEMALLHLAAIFREARVARAMELLLRSRDANEQGGAS